MEHLSSAYQMFHQQFERIVSGLEKKDCLLEQYNNPNKTDLLHIKENLLETSPTVSDSS